MSKQTSQKASVASRYTREGTGADAQFYRVRANGTRRHVPTLSGEALALAQAIRAERTGDKPKTMRQIAADRHLSVSSVRRMLTSLELTEEVTKRTAAARKGRSTRAAKATVVKSEAEPVAQAS